MKIWKDGDVTETYFDTFIYGYSTDKKISNEETFELIRAIDDCPNVKVGCVTVEEVGDSHWHDEHWFVGGNDLKGLDDIADVDIEWVKIRGEYNGVEFTLSYSPYRGRLVINSHGKIDADEFIRKVS